MTIQNLGIVLLAVFVLGACEEYSKPILGLSPSFGDSVRHNMAMQTVNPEGSSKTGPTGLEGHRAAKAIENYQKAQEKEIEEISK